MAKARPRIPTPEVTKDGSTNTGKCALRLRLCTSHSYQSIAPRPLRVASNAVIMAPQQLNTHSTSGIPYTSYSHSTNSSGGTNMHQDSGQVLGTLLLSPIKEMDSSSSNNTLIPGHPTTAALAQAVMPTRLKDAFTASCK